MLPIGPLMKEHRLIEKIVDALQKELTSVRGSSPVDAVRVETMCDCISIYADRCHHGKEEDILFDALGRKNLTAPHRQMLKDLLGEHRRSRELVSELRQGAGRCSVHPDEARKDIIAGIEELITLYPAHIEKEDSEFFIPCMEYFDEEEKDALLAQEREFDRTFIHTLYREKIEGLHRSEK